MTAQKVNNIKIAIYLIIFGIMAGVVGKVEQIPEPTVEAKGVYIQDSIHTYNDLKLFP